MNNPTESEEKRRQLILQIQGLYRDGISITKIADILGLSRQTVNKYKEGSPDNLCVYRRHSRISAYDSLIIKSIQKGYTAAEITRQLDAAGYDGTRRNVSHYVTRTAKKLGLELTKYNSAYVYGVHDAQEKKKSDYITRKGIFNHLWMNTELTDEHRNIIWSRYPVLWELDACIRQFRKVFSRHCMPDLYLFIDRYRCSKVKELAAFAYGLLKDIEAVENAVASPLSNGFVEGTNSKIKTIKKSMYGRCGITLLSAKLMYSPNG